MAAFDYMGKTDKLKHKDRLKIKLIRMTNHTKSKNSLSWTKWQSETDKINCLQHFCLDT